MNSIIYGPVPSWRLGRSLGIDLLPVANKTCSFETMPREDVRDALANAGIVVAKLDVHNQELFRQVNRPIVDLMLSDIIEGIKLFRREFVGKLCLQIMFIEVNKNFAGEIVQTASCLLPDEVQLNAPLRPYLVKPLTSSQMA